MKQWLKNELWNGYSWYERVYMLSMILLQLVVYCFTPDTLIGMVCGIAGVICVVLTAKGKISSYIFNFIQMITYMIICWNAGLYFEFSEQIFYFMACIFGVFLWKKNMTTNDDGTEQVKAKKFTVIQWVITAVVAIVSAFLLGYFGDKVLGSTLPYLDAFTVALAVIAQLLMIWRYREQWMVWIIINISSLIMFIMLEQWAMVAMYVAWTINAFYGWNTWSKLEKKSSK